MVFLMTLAFIPEKYVTVKLIRSIRLKVRRWFYRPVSLTMRGPFFRLGVKCAKRCGGSYMASSCRAPIKLVLKPVSCTEVEMKWTPAYPFNPCHEEHYAVAWSRAEEPKDGKERKWHELEFESGQYLPVDDKKTDDHGRYEKFKMRLDGLPEYTHIKLRVCAIGARGRGPWSREAEVETLAPPDENNGFVGAIEPSPPCDGARSVYHWYQSKHEVGVRIPLPEDWRPKQMRVKVTATRIEVRHVADAKQPDESRLVLAGTLSLKIKPDELYWECDTSELQGWHIHVTMRKADLMSKWASLLQGDAHPKVDINRLRLNYEGNLMTELGCNDLWD